MATLTLTATPEPDNVPPRVLLEITDTGSPAITDVTISRLDPDGRSRLVRTPDGGPLALSGSASIYDYEAWYGEEVTYSIAEANAPTDAAMLDVPDPWLIHVGAPSRSMPIDLRVGSNSAELWDIEQGGFRVLERVDPVVVTSGARVAPSSSLIVATDTEADRERMRALLADGSPLLLNVPPSLGIGIPTAYIAVGPVRPSRRSTVGTLPLWDIELPYQVVGRPAGGTQAALTWDDVATVGVDDYTADAGSQYLTWQAITDAGVDSWADLAAPTT